MSLANILIIIFGSASYGVGLRKMWLGKYLPSTFSRVIWALLAINSYVGLSLVSESKPALILGTIFLAGNILMMVLSFWKGTRSFGKIEKISTALLLLSIIVWIFFKAPLVNLLISLFAHLIGSIPTYRKAWEKPKSEDFTFWILFTIASILSLLALESYSFEEILFPLYFVLFDGGMTLLTLRKRNT